MGLRSEVGASLHRPPGVGHSGPVRATALFCLCVVLAACAAPSSTDATSGTQPPATGTSTPDGSSTTTAGFDDPYSFDLSAAFDPAVPADPLLVEVAVDEAAAAETVAWGEAVVLTADGPDATRYTLEIPAGALLGETEIRMVPAVGIGGLPLDGGLVGAVRLEPDGLVLLEPATLTIETPTPVDPAELIGFGLAGVGTEELYGYPVEVEGNLIRLTLTHFSGYGAGRGTKENTWAMGQRKPSEYGREMMQYLFEILRHRAEFMGDRVDFTDEELQQIRQYDEQLNELMRTWFEVDVRPTLAEFETNEELLIRAIWRWLDWAERVMRGIGQWDQLQDLWEDGQASFDRGVAHAIEERSRRCVEENDPIQGLHLLGLAELIMKGVSQLGAGEQTDTIGPVFEKLHQCWQFELRYQSTVKWTNTMDPTFAIVSEVEAVLPLQPKPAPLNWFTASGVLTYEDYRWETELGQACTLTYIHEDIPVDFEVRFSFKGWGTLHDPEPAVWLTMQPGAAAERMDWQCPGGAVNYTPEGLGWHSGFYMVHSPIRIGTSGRYEFKDGWVFGDDKPVYARWGELTESATGMEPSQVSDTYMFRLVHTPGQ